MTEGDPPKRESFGARQRLKKTWEFRKVYDAGRTHFGPRVVVHVLSVPEGPSRVGIVAGRKVGESHQRNRAKRLLREAYRRSQALLPDFTWTVLVARKSAASAAYEVIRGDLEKAYIALFGPRG